MQGISGKVAIITGGASGIGSGLVRAFVAEGALVVLADRIDAGEEVARGLGASCLFVRTDLRDDDQIARLVDATVARFGGIDFLINAACTYADKGSASDRAMWQDGFNVNVIGHIILAQRAHPHLIRSTAASIVNFTSEVAHVAAPGRWVYPATKAAIDQVTRSQAMDLAEDGIRVNSVMPGWTWKAWHDNGPPELLAQYTEWARRFHMLGRVGTHKEVSDAVLFLCSEHATFMTGSCLRVDGGHSAMGPVGRETVLPTKIREAAARDTPSPGVSKGDAAR